MNITFGEYVKQKRLSKRITLRAFAGLVEISPTYISCMENNEKTAPSSKILKNIEQVLELEKEELDIFYDLAAKSMATDTIPLDIVETIQGNPTIKIALRVAKNFDATDEEWADFMQRLKEREIRG